ncbi:hypothetical protein G9A89_010413 [Geosiphon pyriformis]|nr:hypothetical protein G9A89_010413 [Geosiphon pyriformis]
MQYLQTTTKFLLQGGRWEIPEDLAFHTKLSIQEPTLEKLYHANVPVPLTKEESFPENWELESIYSTSSQSTIKDDEEIPPTPTSNFPFSSYNYFLETIFEKNSLEKNSQLYKEPAKTRVRSKSKRKSIPTRSPKKSQDGTAVFGACQVYEIYNRNPMCLLDYVQSTRKNKMKLRTQNKKQKRC